MNEMEEKLWNYIDGFCTEEEQKTISQLIEQDENYQRIYTELMSFQKSITMIEPDEPAMGFTFKVMENIRAEKAKTPLKTNIDKRIILVIAAFFICTIAALLGIVFFNLNWTSANPVKLPEVHLPAPATYLNPVIIKGFLFFDLILGMYFLDHYFRKWFFEKK